MPCVSTADTCRCHPLAKAFPTGRTSGSPFEHSLSWNRNKSLRRQLLLPTYRLGWLHYVGHNVFTDLVSHIPANTSREAIMEAGPDASIRNLIGKGRHVGKAVGHAGCSG